jgi:hypothetical protein
MPYDAVLAPDERVEGRSFTDPEHSQEDLSRMRLMAHQLITTYGNPVVCDFAPGKRPVCQSDPQGRHFRIDYLQPDRLFSAKDITVVGFFGHKRPDADIRPLLQADRQFERQFHHHPGLLSLSTVRLPSGDFANLVLFASPEDKDSWNMSEPHRALVAEISPPYYRSVRLNNGLLPGGLAAPDDLYLLRVKYLDFASNPPWRGLREFEMV